MGVDNPPRDTDGMGDFLTHFRPELGFHVEHLWITFSSHNLWGVAL